MAKRRTLPNTPDGPGRFELGPFRLAYREDRDTWSIAWTDPGGAGRERRTRRKATGVNGGCGPDGKPPQAAQDALADHYAAWRNPAPLAQEEAYVEGLLADWLEHVSDEAFDPVRARYAVRPWITFFEKQRSEGRITRGPIVPDITRALCMRYVKWRKAQPGGRSGTKISGATVSRELAALRAALNWAQANNRIPHAPTIPDVPAKHRALPRSKVFSRKQVAALLDAAASRPDREHVLLFLIIMISTNGRVEAILELESEQMEGGLIDFLAEGRQQTKKRRAVVPIAPTLKPWLKGVTGKVIQYRTSKIDSETGQSIIISRPTASIRTAFEACLIDAGICEIKRDADGKPVMLKPRARLGETKPRAKLVPVGSINTMRHTITTEHHRLNVPEAQIEVAAGHTGTGTNKRNYRHIRPEYLRAFIAGVERYWKLIDKFTSVHRRPPARPSASKKTGS